MGGAARKPVDEYRGFLGAEVARMHRSTTLVYHGFDLCDAVCESFVEEEAYDGEAAVENVEVVLCRGYWILEHVIWGVTGSHGLVDVSWVWGIRKIYSLYVSEQAPSDIRKLGVIGLL